MRVISRLEEVRADLKKYKHEIGDFYIEGPGKVKSIIAKEKVKFKAGNIKAIKIKQIEIPGNHIGIISSYARNKFGHVIAIGESVALPIEMNRSADYATFIAALEGKLEKNDLIGILILLPIKIFRS
jgi:hypothetical protein